jgi:serine/threonine protein kinase
VHCDVSPDNALVSWEGEIKLLDFGIARAATGLSNYKEGMLMGKLGYVAPEQASVRKTWDHRVDVFAAGIILFELLTGTKPFPKATDVDSLVASRKAEVPRPSSLDDRIPKELDAIVARALAYRPEKRYPTARAFADALVDVLFPTPHSSIQDLLGQQIRNVFGETIVRQRAARAHDALVLKVLQHLAEQEQAQASHGHARGERQRAGAFELTALADPSATPNVPRPADASGRERKAVPGLPRRDIGRRPSSSAVRKALALGLAMAVGAAGGAYLTHVGVKGTALGALSGARVIAPR